MNDLLQNLGSLNEVKVVGLAVLIVIAFLLGWVAPKRVVDDLRSQRDKAQEQRDDAIEILRHRTERDETILAFLRAIAGKSAPDRGDGA